MEEKDNHIGRISLVFLLLLILTMFVRIFILQNLGQIRNKSYSDPIISSSLVRGTIYDRHGNILALQAPNYGFDVTLQTSDPGYIASILDPYLSMDALSIEQQLKSGETFFQISYIPDIDEAKYLHRLIKNLELDNEITLVLKETRKYPSENSTRLIIGDVDENLDGISGLEKLYNDQLKAVPKLGIGPVYGSDLVLTLDAAMQISLNNLPLLKDFEESTIAIISDKNEILAYHGNVSDELLATLVYSISSDGETEVFEQKPYFPEENLLQIDGYKIYIDAKEENIKNILLIGVKNILKIKADS